MDKVKELSHLRWMWSSWPRVLDGQAGAYAVGRSGAVLASPRLGVQRLKEVLDSLDR